MPDTTTATAGVPPDPSLRALLRPIVALAAPTTLIALLQVGAQLGEMAIAARQGTAALAAWAVMLPFAMLMQQMSTGAMGGGIVSAIARALGAGRGPEASALVRHALAIATGFGVVFAVGVSVAADRLLAGVAGDAAAVAGTGYALWLFGIGALPIWLANTLASVLRGGGRHALAARVLGLVWIAHAPLAWLLAEPLGMGLAGIGAAMALLWWIATLALGGLVAIGGAGFKPGLRGGFEKPLFARILAVGMVACLMAAISNLTSILVTAQIKSYGTEAVAAYGISVRLEFLVIPLAFGVGSALTALVGRAVGAGDWARARRIAWAGGLLALAATGAIGLAVALAAAPFARLFTADPAVLTIATQALGIVGLGFGGFGIGMALYFASMGAGRMGYPLAAAFARIGLAVGAGAWLADGLGLGLPGHFLGVAIGITAYGLVTAAGVRDGVWSARGG